jgi:hypothetical protein
MISAAAAAAVRASLPVYRYGWHVGRRLRHTCRSNTHFAYVPPTCQM